MDDNGLKKHWLDSWWGRWFKIPIILWLIILSGVGALVVMVCDFVKEMVFKDWS